MTLNERCEKINELFRILEVVSGKLTKEALVNNFRAFYPELNEDLDYCFEVLAGKHKLGYTFIVSSIDKYDDNPECTIKDKIEFLKTFSSTDDDIYRASISVPLSCRKFIAKLVNREFRLGYSNKHNMITFYSPMLAKKYQETFKDKDYYIQEKLDGNRCIAYYDYDEEKWCFQSRSGKPLKVEFDMSWVDDWYVEHYPSSQVEYPVFDGEIMTLEHAGSRDFNRTSGAINGKYTDKSGLHYFIYDIIATKLTYRQRKEILDTISNSGPDCHILPVLDYVHVYPNHDYNCQLDVWLDKIVDKGGEGLILRDPDATYQLGKRSDALLKYKKTQTMDLRIIDWNEGKGKYEGAIGSFVCETDDHSIVVNVAGMDDDTRWSDPNAWIGKIIEVAYFDVSVSSATGQKSLRFPRMKKLRDDKNDTSTY